MKTSLILASVVLIFINLADSRSLNDEELDNVLKLVVKARTEGKNSTGNARPTSYPPVGHIRIRKDYHRHVKGTGKRCALHATHKHNNATVRDRPKRLASATSTKKPPKSNRRKLKVLSVQEKTKLLQLMSVAKQVLRISTNILNKRSNLSNLLNGQDNDNMMNIKISMDIILAELSEMNIARRKTTFFTNVQHSPEDVVHLLKIITEVKNSQSQFRDISKRGSLLKLNQDATVNVENDVLKVKGKIDIMRYISNTLKIRAKKRRNPLSLKEKAILLNIGDEVAEVGKQIKLIARNNKVLFVNTTSSEYAILQRIRYALKVVRLQLQDMDIGNRVALTKINGTLSDDDRINILKIKAALRMLISLARNLLYRAKLLNKENAGIGDNNDILRVKNALESLQSLIDSLNVKDAANRMSGGLGLMLTKMTTKPGPDNNTELLKSSTKKTVLSSKQAAWTTAINPTTIKVAKTSLASKNLSSSLNETTVKDTETTATSTTASSSAMTTNTTAVTVATNASTKAKTAPNALKGMTTHAKTTTSAATTTTTTGGTTTRTKTTKHIKTAAPSTKKSATRMKVTHSADKATTKAMGTAGTIVPPTKRTSTAKAKAVTKKNKGIATTIKPKTMTDSPKAKLTRTKVTAKVPRALKQSAKQQSGQSNNERSSSKPTNKPSKGGPRIFLKASSDITSALERTSIREVILLMKVLKKAMINLNTKVDSHFRHLFDQNTDNSNMQRTDINTNSDRISLLDKELKERLDQLESKLLNASAAAASAINATKHNEENKTKKRTETHRTTEQVTTTTVPSTTTQKPVVIIVQPTEKAPVVPFDDNKVTLPPKSVEYLSKLLQKSDQPVEEVLNNLNPSNQKVSISNILNKQISNLVASTGTPSDKLSGEQPAKTIADGRNANEVASTNQNSGQTSTNNPRQTIIVSTESKSLPDSSEKLQKENVDDSGVAVTAPSTTNSNSPAGKTDKEARGSKRVNGKHSNASERLVKSGSGEHLKSSAKMHSLANKFRSILSIQKRQGLLADDRRRRQKAHALLTKRNKVQHASKIGLQDNPRRSWDKYKRNNKRWQGKFVQHSGDKSHRPYKGRYNTYYSKEPKRYD